MDISTSAAIESVLAAQQAATKSEVGYKVAAKALDSHRAAGDAAVQLIEAAGQIGRAPGKGGSVDTAG